MFLVSVLLLATAINRATLQWPKWVGLGYCPLVIPWRALAIPWEFRSEWYLFFMIVGDLLDLCRDVLHLRSGFWWVVFTNTDCSLLNGHVYGILRSLMKNTQSFFVFYSPHEKQFVIIQLRDAPYSLPSLRSVQRNHDIKWYYVAAAFELSLAMSGLLFWWPFRTWYIGTQCCGCLWWSFRT